jgi:hypothetical protein
LIAALPALLLLLWAGPAQADSRYGVVSLDLRAEPGDAPTHLCVVSEAQSARARRLLVDTLLPQTEAVDEGRRNRTWFVKSEVWSGDRKSAQRLQCAKQPKGSTADPLGDCRPRIEVPPGLAGDGDLYVACTPDSLTQGTLETGPRPLYILLEHLEGSPPAIESVRLAGGIATIGVQANLDQVLVTARSLGGHYLPHQVSVRGTADSGRDNQDDGPPRRNIKLDLAPRCDFVEVRLPRTRLVPADRDRLSVRVHGMEFDVSRCVGPLTSSEVLQIRIPQAPLGVGTIDVDLAATEEGKAAARFGASWEGAWPRKPFPLQFNQVSFSWTRPACIYPEGRCPVAVLESGTQCDGTPTEGGCDYRCPGDVTEDAIDLSFPLKVTFRKSDPVQEWEDKLVQNGQTLTSYVPNDETYLNANVNGWRTNEPANRIKEVEVFGEDGGVHRYSVSHVPTLQMKVPGASCEPIAFHVRGDRAHEDAVASVDDGQIEFGDPRRTARRIAVNLTMAVGGGPAWSDKLPGTDGNDVPPVYFSGLAMLALQYRPRPPGWARVGYEVRIGGTLGRWGFIENEATASSSAETTNQEQRLGWGRVLFEPGLVFAAHERVGVGAGLGLGFSFPFRRSETVVRDSLNFIWSPSVDGRFYIRKWVALMVQFRGVFGEKAFAVTRTPILEDTTNPNDPNPSLDDPTTQVEAQTDEVPRQARARSLLSLFGVVFQF